MDLLRFQNLLTILSLVGWNVLPNVRNGIYCTIIIFEPFLVLQGGSISAPASTNQSSDEEGKEASNKPNEDDIATDGKEIKTKKHKKSKKKSKHVDEEQHYNVCDNNSDDDGHGKKHKKSKKKSKDTDEEQHYNVCDNNNDDNGHGMEKNIRNQKRSQKILTRNNITMYVITTVMMIGIVKSLRRNTRRNRKLNTPMITQMLMWRYMIITKFPSQDKKVKM